MRQGPANGLGEACLDAVLEEAASPVNPVTKSSDAKRIADLTSGRREWRLQNELEQEL
jgi:hypothetical protein